MGKGHSTDISENKNDIGKDIVLTRFKLKIPPEKWLHTITIDFPNCSFLILSLMPLSEHLGNCLLQIEGANLDRDIAKIYEGLRTFEFETLGKTSEYILLNIKMRDPWILQAVIKYQVMLHYPLVVNDGKIEFQLISSRKKIDSLFTAFEREDMGFEIREIGGYKPKSLLTRRQDEVLRTALNLGYYDIPRQIRLSNLAITLKISPSALSENFRRIEKKLAQQYLTIS